jgi:hypothetical protein
MGNKMPSRARKYCHSQTQIQRQTQNICVILFSLCLFLSLFRALFHALSLCLCIYVSLPLPLNPYLDVAIVSAFAQQQETVARARGEVAIEPAHMCVLLPGWSDGPDDGQSIHTKPWWVSEKTTYVSPHFLLGKIQYAYNIPESNSLFIF